LKTLRRRFRKSFGGQKEAMARPGAQLTPRTFIGRFDRIAERLLASTAIWPQWSSTCRFRSDLQSMPLTSQASPERALYLVTPPLAAADAEAFAGIFAATLEAAPVACALLRLLPDSLMRAEAVAAPFLRAANDADCALLIENDARLAVRLGADGVHVAGAGADLSRAIERLKPQRIVGAGALRTRDEAMIAGEMGADYVMFGDFDGATPTMGLKPLADRVAWWAEIFETPCVACAATLAEARALKEAGADFVALGEAVFGSSSPAAAARRAQASIASVSAAAP
jgi:thiamine-phosphate pyrophosphorylase